MQASLYVAECAESKADLGSAGVRQTGTQMTGNFKDTGSREHSASAGIRKLPTAACETGARPNCFPSLNVILQQQQLHVWYSNVTSGDSWLPPVPSAQGLISRCSVQPVLVSDVAWHLNVTAYQSVRRTLGLQKWNKRNLALWLGLG